jgi:hypothetical protein
MQVVGDSSEQFGSYVLSLQSNDDIAAVPDNNGAYPRSLEGR